MGFADDVCSTFSVVTLLLKRRGGGTSSKGEYGSKPCQHLKAFEATTNQLACKCWFNQPNCDFIKYGIQHEQNTKLPFQSQMDGDSFNDPVAGSCENNHLANFRIRFDVFRVRHRNHWAFHAINSGGRAACRVIGVRGATLNTAPLKTMPSSEWLEHLIYGQT